MCTTCTGHDVFARHRVELSTDDVLLHVAGERLARCGLVTFEAPLGRAEVRRLAGRLLAIRPHRDADLDGVTLLTDRGGVADRLGYAGFGTGELLPHTDGSALAWPPSALLMVCAQAASCGGESSVVDGAAVHATLAATAPDLLAALCAPRTAVFGDGYCGAVFEPTPDGRLTVRVRFDGLVQFAAGARGAVSLLRQVVEHHTLRLVLRPGQGYLLDNRRMLHGRSAFVGLRVMYRILGNPHPGMRYEPGFEPAAYRALPPLRQRLPLCGGRHRPASVVTIGNERVTA